MLKLSVKFIFSFAAIISLVLVYFGSSQGDPKLVVAMLAAIGYAVMSAIDIWDYRKSKKETEASESADRKKRMRNLLDDFKINFATGATGLINLKIIESKSELTFKRLYELSQDARVMSLLGERAVGIRNGLEEFRELYVADR